MYRQRMWHHHHHHHRPGAGLGLILLFVFLLVFGGFLLKALFWIIPLVILFKVLSSNKCARQPFHDLSGYGEKRKNDDFFEDEKPKRRTFEDGTPII